MGLIEFVQQGVKALESGWVDARQLVRAIELYKNGGGHAAYALLEDHRRETDIEKSVDLHFWSEASAVFDVPAVDGGNRIVPDIRYVSESLLSEGGMGRVYIAMDRALGRRVALKTLRDEHLGSSGQVQSLAREARLTGMLEHPNIVPIYDVGIAGTAPYYVMRLVDETSLEQVLSALRAGEPEAVHTWTLPRLLRTYIQVCLAVHYAHARGVIHCDLKPGNILLGKFGEVLVGDWGLASSTSDGAFVVGGTPSYMAPEQLESGRAIDPRTDVFALGVILYRMLALRTPFTGSTVSELLRQRQTGAPPRPPSQVAPRGRVVPHELEAIAMKAMASAPTGRYETTQALAEAIERFLEGTAEREQRQRRALGLIAQGDELTARYQEAVLERASLVSEAGNLSNLTEPWAPLEARRRVWEAEDELTVFDALTVRILQEAITSYEQALVEIPGNVDARRGLARLYADQVERARARRAELDRVYFEGLLRQYDDDGLLSRAGSRPGWISIDLQGDVEQVVLARFEQVDRQLVLGAERRLRRGALDAVPAAQGSYAVTVRSHGRAIQIPVLVVGDRESRVRLDLTTTGLPGSDEVLVVAATTSSGDSTTEDGPKIGPFFMQLFPVTFRKYIAFLEDLLARDPGSLRTMMPQVRDNVPLWTVEDGALVPTRALGEVGLSHGTWHEVPVFGISAIAAMAYAEWLSLRTGRAYRLPMENEWELAARGADDRRYPWGDHFEAIFCKMRFSRMGSARPEPVGAFPTDVSPYGVRDMGGGIAEFCGQSASDRTSEPSVGLVSRGGAWSDPPADCAISSRTRVGIDARSKRVGIRLVRDVVPSVTDSSE